MPFAFVLPAIAQDSNSLSTLEEAAFRAAVESVTDSVVQIRTIGGLDTLSGALSADGPTTGLVISADGYIVSSAFNFLQQPASIIVTFASGKQAPAELVATDHSRMLVLLKVAGVNDLPVPEQASAEEIRPGQWAIAVGRTFHADRTNVSVGVVSAVGRMFGKAVQTDAAVSMANYGGPLVDIRGRVMGIIVPIAPQGASEVAGVEWYDSGIGFAVPLSSIAESIERMKKGEDQRAGLLGIGMPAKNPHSVPAELTAVRPGSPAAQAGLRKDDRIIEVDGRPIRTTTDLRFALGPRYGGETVNLVVKRGDEQLERAIELVGELAVFRHAYLGILPMRPPSTADEQAEQKTNPTGVAARMVCDGSPAADAGLRAGDRIVRINDTDIASTDDALGAMNNLAPGDKVELRRVRDGETANLTLTAARMPTSVPNELPAAYDAEAAEAPGERKGTTNDLKLPEFAHQCKVYVPASAAAKPAKGAMLWLQPLDETEVEDVIRPWQTICDRDGLLLIVPVAAETERWERTDLEYLRRLIDRVIAQYQVDRHRVVVYGQDASAATAWLLGLASRDAFRGIATAGAPLPRQIRVPQNEPAQRLAIFAAMPSGNDAAAIQMAEGLRKLSDAGYTVTTVSVAANATRLTDSQREELARWIDTLDRF